ncbi:uncharacterized protein LOC111679634 [Lucilia cuprina]|uniref:uncharacterized protein LOC111679634 n=1 Tax=Lucilia cuprina TaxID=7375 RepID=UPI000C719430|nr:uncharacterized protein LOC111679634 [Lucilia cuprina]KAI8121132.1 hypothetical protein CVS40_7659 [Lucilia cuprina]
MAPSQMENQQEQTLGQGYTHKKFNCGYSHKKLGLRLRKREQENKENLSQNQSDQVKSNKPASKGLFRPYALDNNNTPRKRKLSTSSESSEESYYTPIITSAQTSYSYQQQSSQLGITATATSSPQTCPSPALSPNSYAMRLQRQRAALYMRYMMQMQQQNPTAVQTATGYPMGYPNITAPIFNGF